MSIPKTPFRSFGCRCVSLEEHMQNIELLETSSTKKPNIKSTQGKLTSEGYEPKPAEKVEVRGD